MQRRSDIVIKTQGTEFVFLNTYFVLEYKNGDGMQNQTGTLYIDNKTLMYSFMYN